MWGGRIGRDATKTTQTTKTSASQNFSGTNENLVACNAFPASEPLTVEQILDMSDAASPPWRGSSTARRWFSHFGAERFAKHSDLCCGAQWWNQGRPQYSTLQLFFSTQWMEGWKNGCPMVLFFDNLKFEVIVQLQRRNQGSARWLLKLTLSQNEGTWSKAITVTFAIDQPSQAKRLTVSKWWGCRVPQLSQDLHSFERSLRHNNAVLEGCVAGYGPSGRGVFAQRAFQVHNNHNNSNNNRKKFEENCNEMEIEGGYWGQQWGFPPTTVSNHPPRWIVRNDSKSQALPHRSMAGRRDCVANTQGFVFANTVASWCGAVSTSADWWYHSNLSDNDDQFLLERN